MTTYQTMSRPLNVQLQLFKIDRIPMQHMNNFHITPIATRSSIQGCFPCMEPFHHIIIRVTSHHCHHILHLKVHLCRHPQVPHQPLPKQTTINNGHFICDVSQKIFCLSRYLLLYSESVIF